MIPGEEDQAETEDDRPAAVTGERLTSSQQGALALPVGAAGGAVAGAGGSHAGERAGGLAVAGSSHASESGLALAGGSQQGAEGAVVGERPAIVVDDSEWPPLEWQLRLSEDSSGDEQWLPSARSARRRKRRKRVSPARQPRFAVLSAEGGGRSGASSIDDRTSL